MAHTVSEEAFRLISSGHARKGKDLVEKNINKVSDVEELRALKIYMSVATCVVGISPQQYCLDSSHSSSLAIPFA